MSETLDRYRNACQHLAVAADMWCEGEIERPILDSAVLSFRAAAVELRVENEQLVLP